VLPQRRLHGPPVNWGDQAHQHQRVPEPRQRRRRRWRRRQWGRRRLRGWVVWGFRLQERAVWEEEV
ncbi:hypothetical protein MNEG_5091, partial [Monoraphidium neglectum]